MGVPAFYRWLSEKYPKIVQDVLEQRIHLSPNSTSITLPFDLTKPNPSGLECDNLYIDMNGIIHPCSHPENGPQPNTEEDMYDNVCRYVDRLMRAARPRKLLYLAIDGVAPRAKMNQQRSRRFRSAQEAREQKELENNIKKSLMEAGHMFESKAKDNHDNNNDDGNHKNKGVTSAWDSNVITPGTKFMLNLSEYIRFYIRKRISTDPAWKQITVIFSDASIPGEGEHKIMSHIRLQRTQPNYNPNLVHILHGLDADLIMLALATHEAHFYIMREEVLFGRRHAEQVERMREESGFADAQQQLDEAAGTEAMSLPENKTKTLQRVSVPILREYLALEFADLLQSLPGHGFRDASFERLIDDIVFLCFFVGNDFLPHLPSLDIRDGALDFLFNVYKRVLPSLGDFITDHGGEVNLSHVDVILAEVGAIEDYVFQMKYQNEQNDKKRREEEKERRKNLKNGKVPYANHVQKEPAPAVRGRAARILQQQQQSTSSTKSNGNGVTALGKNKKNEANKKSLDDNLRAAEELKASLNKNKDTTKEISEGKELHVKRRVEEISPDNDDGNKTISDDVESNKDTIASESSHIIDVIDEDEDSNDQGDEATQEAIDKSMKVLKDKLKEESQKKLNAYAENVDDKVRLHESGWKNRYYTDKCKADDVSHNGGREHLYRSYVVGLCWVMKYYYDGCPSWKWFFPFHYAPFASDLKNIERFKKDCKFEAAGEPFKPVEQLMAVLPEDSSHAIPKASRWLMADQESPIIDFYPKEVPCDPNGKAMPWLWVVLLPFIDEDRLLSALHPTMKDWKDSELLCNARGVDDGYVYCHVNHSLSSSLVPILDAEEKTQKAEIEDCKIFGFLRCPLSNEIYPLDKVSDISPPLSSKRITNDFLDDLLTSPIETNAALCAAFSEPTKEKHRSILLNGAVPPRPTIRPEEFEIRRPRLNRGGTIANMGGGRRGQSHQVGYGSMNIGSYERELAIKSGRGGQMNQAGTRQWGAMEPTPKRQRYDHGNTQNNSYPHQRHNHPSHQYPHSRDIQRDQRQNNSGTQQRWQPPPNSHHGTRWIPPTSKNLPPPSYHSQHPPAPTRNGYNFQNFNNSHSYSRHGQQYQQNQHTQQRPQQQQSQQSRSGVNSNVMNSLRAQLASTLNRNRQGGHGQSQRR